MYSSVPSSPWHPGPNLDRTPSSPPLTSPTSPSRTSRLRGLSYLRTYTQNHILSRDGHTSSNSQQRPGIARATSYPSPTASPTPASAPRTPAAASIPTLTLSRQQTSPTAQRTTADLPSLDTTAQENLGETSGWVPTVGGLSVVSRIASEPQSTNTFTSSAVLSGNDSSAVSTVTPSMTRTRSATVGAETLGLEGSSSQTNESPASTQIGASNAKAMAHQVPSIRFLAHQDPRATRPSLSFPQMSRILRTETEIIRVGRYSEKDALPVLAANVPSAAPVGFKSKVVSRRHCEFWQSGGRWFIKDVKSSSGTFLNHIRLSSPGTESKPYPVNDGDIVQLGIDFKGGEEMIFRCVKIRVELNKGWQVGPSSFNVQSHKRLRELNKHPASGSSQDCSICLGPIAPCQSLFVAPCSHTWHYKCIRVIINGPQWPHFCCPNCRSIADLEAELEEPAASETSHEEAEVEEDTRNTVTGPGAGLSGKEWDELMHKYAEEPVEVREAILQAGATRQAHESLDEVTEAARSVAQRRLAQSSEETANTPDVVKPGPELGESNDDSDPDHGVNGIAGSMRHLNVDASPSPVATTGSQPPLISNSTVPPVDIVVSRGSISNGTNRSSARTSANGRSDRTPSPDGTSSSLDVALAGTEGPMTPRNDAGPFIFDGSAGQPSAARRTTINLAAAATTPLSEATLKP